LELVILKKNRDERVQLKTDSRRMASVSLTFYHIGVCTVTLNYLLQEVRFSVLCNGRKPCVLSVPKYAVHFETDSLHFGNIHEEKEEEEELVVVSRASWEI
jgi:hypothetical protein